MEEENQPQLNRNLESKLYPKDSKEPNSPLGESGKPLHWTRRVGLDWDATLISAVFFMCGAIGGAGIDLIIESLVVGNLGLGTAIAGLLAINSTFVFAAITVLNRIRKGINSEINSISTEVTKIAKDTYRRAAQDINEIKSQVNTAVRETHDLTHNELNDIKEEVLSVVKNIQNTMDYQIQIRTGYIKNGQEKDPGYIASLQRIREARKSILIIGDYSPTWKQLHGTSERNAYLEAIEEKIKDHIILNPNQEFKYTRIIQRDQSIIDNMKKLGRRANGIILAEGDMKGDEQAYHHCYRVLELKNEAASNSRVEISLRMSAPIPNSPSILIVDNRYILFTIPVTQSSSKQNEYLGGDEYLVHQTDGVLFFEDLADGRAIADAFISIFERVKDQTTNIVDVEKPSKPLYT